jgi:purine-cytosine permease-like protein
VYAARYGVDMDLLTRGAGFGYIGSTITSLIYASFTFIFFALEAAVMAYALELAFDIPPAWGYLICALVVIPLVTHGVTGHQPPAGLDAAAVAGDAGGALCRMCAALHPWCCLRAGALSGEGHAAGFSLPLFGAALTVGIALITQMGEQADYLRFMPARTPANRGRWWLGCWWAGRAGWCWAC